MTMIAFRKLTPIIALLLVPACAEAQVMRSQIYEQFMRAHRLQSLGKDSAAIESLNQVAQMVPEFPPTYLRQADIYNNMYERTHNVEALNAAVFMYRKYLTLEFNEELISEPSQKLRLLEDQLQVSHFEEEESRDSQEESANEYIPVITDREEAQALASQQTEVQVDDKPEVELVALVKQEPAISQPATATASATNSSLIPQLGKPIFSYLDFYKTDIPTTPWTDQIQSPSLNAQSLSGHWVSEIIKADGRELWAFDIKAEGRDDYVVLFSPLSGIVNETKEEGNFYRRAFLLTKSYLQKAQLMSGIKSEVINERVKAKTSPNGLAFSIEVENQYKSSTTLFKWGKNLVSNLQMVLPFGAAVSNYVSNYVDQRVANDKQKSNMVTYTFNCQPKTDGIMKCEISSIINSVGENGKARSKVGATTQTSLIRTDANYTVGGNESNYSSKDYGQWDKLFAKVKQDARHDINYNYPLAILYYYGVGTQADAGRALELMTVLASKPGDTRAKAWLSTYFYHKAYTDESKNIFTRRKYLKSAQYWSKVMNDLHQKEWYGVKGDMCNSDHTRDIFSAMQDSALYYYQKGDEAGDIYSTYRLGAMYLLPERKNLAEAQRLLLKAANGGQENAILALAQLAYRQHDLQAYLHNLRLAADLGCPEAYAEAAQALMAGPSHGMKINPVESMRMNRLAIRSEKDDWIPIILSFGYDIEPYLN